MSSTTPIARLADLAQAVQDAAAWLPPQPTLAEVADLLNAVDVLGDAAVHVLNHLGHVLRHHADHIGLNEPAKVRRRIGLARDSGRWMRNDLEVAIAALRLPEQEGHDR